MNGKKNIKEDGGGTYYILKNGQVFEKVGVNHSTVEGFFQKNLNQIFLEQKKATPIGLLEYQL